MNKITLTAKELRPAVVKLCGQGNYHGASHLVISFMKRGVVDFDAARICMEASKSRNDVPQMVALAQGAVSIAPRDWRSWQLKYQSLYADSRWKEALQSLDKIAKLANELNSEHFLAKADIYQRLLEPDNSLAMLESVTELTDSSAKSRYQLLKATAYSLKKDNQSVIDHLEAWLRQSPNDKFGVSAWKLLGKSYDALGKYEMAFKACAKGNEIQLKLENKVFSDNSMRKRIEVFRTLFTKSWVKSWSRVRSPSLTPVFMIGFPRSGTTLLEQVLDAHRAVQAMEEPPTMSTVFRQASALMQSKAQLDGRMKGNSHWKVQWLTVMNYMADLNDDQVESLRKTYYSIVEQELALQRGNTLIEKMPLDTVDIGLILRLFPDAKFIVSLRHPCDCVLSGYMQNFKMNDAMANFLDLENAASFYKHVMKLLWQYEEVFNLKDRMHYIRYEDLVMDLEGESRKVLDFLGLPWDDAVLNYDEHAKQRGTLATPSYQGVTQKIYDSSKERWRHYAKWMEPVLPHFREAAERYGYDLSYSPEKSQ